MSPYIHKNVFPPGTIPLSVNGVTSRVIASSTIDVVAPVIQLGFLGGLLGVNSKKEEKPLFPQVRKKVEAMIENYHRFEAYQAEVHAITQLEINFYEWLKLTTSTEVKPDRAELLYIIPSKPLDLKLSS